MINTTTISIPELRTAVRGRVIAPGDTDYDDARAVFYGWINRRPAVIVRPADAADVATAIALARDTGLELAVRGGGHSFAGHSASEGGIVLDLRDMRALEVDAGRRTAWAGAGLTAGEYTAAAGAHGLATGFGDTGAVGIGGLTLGGGVGFLVRKYGLTIDDLLAADIVTADGQIRPVGADTDPDLFWAIRGGGGNFGVVTRFQYRLHEVGTIVGGLLILPATAGLIRSFIAEADTAPEELSVIANVMPAPPAPFLPAEFHRRLVVMAFLVYAGATEAGQRAIAPFRALATPVADMVRPMPYPEIYKLTEGGPHPVAAVARSMFLDVVDDHAAETIVHYLQASTAPVRVAQLRVLGGAVERVPVGATAYAHRRRRIMTNVAAVYERPEETAAHEAWVTEFAAALRPAPSGAGQRQGDGVYANFLGDEGAARVREAYPGATWERLAAIKARYDPTNFFRLNQNIPPGGTGNNPEYDGTVHRLQESTRR